MHTHIHGWETTTSDSTRKCDCGAVKIWVKDHWRVIEYPPKEKRRKRVVAKNCVMF